MTDSKKAPQRTYKALFAVSGSKEDLKSFEEVLKSHGAEGTMSNETGRMLYHWLITYADFETESKKDCKLTYAYRSTNCKDTSKPKVLLPRTARERMAKNYYVRDGKFVRTGLKRMFK